MIIIYDDFEKVDKNDLFDQVDAVLGKRQRLWERYSRGISFESEGNEENGTGDKLQILFEKFIVDTATGYLSGPITYDVDVSSEVEKRIGKTIFGKEGVDETLADELRYVINTLAINNDDDCEETLLFRQALLYGSTYERIWENTNNQLQYLNLDALNTVAIWDNSIDPQVVAVVSAFQTKEGTLTKYWYRVYTSNKILVYSRENRTEVTDVDRAVKLEDNKDHNWGQVPVIVYESNFSIIDKCASLITAYQDLLNNVRNTYQYNDTDCKMKIVGYRAQNPVMIPNPKKGQPNQPDMILNPARQQEDEYILAGKTFYVEQGGDADWLTKPVKAEDVTAMLKYYVDSIFQMTGIPNTSDLAFNSTDLNASAIDRKFYVMNITTADIREGVRDLIRKRFKMLLERINFKFGTTYTMDNVSINMSTNLPSMTDENIDQMMKLNGVLSQETVIEKLGYDWETEKNRKEDELNAAMEQVTNRTKEDGQGDGEEEDGADTGDNDTDEEDRGTDKEVPEDNKQ